MMREIKLKLTLAGLVTFQFGIQLMISVCFQFIQPIHRAKTILAEMNSNWNINDAEWNYLAHVNSKFSLLKYCYISLLL